MFYYYYNYYYYYYYFFIKKSTLWVFIETPLRKQYWPGSDAVECKNVYFIAIGQYKANFQ